MTFEAALVYGIILHFVGDYVLQNEWMAANKTRHSFPALVHATIYSLPFLWICPSEYWLILWSTHFFIDRYRLAVIWIQFYNFGYNRNGDKKFTFNEKSNNGYNIHQPIWLTTWLAIIIDNTMHVIINSYSIFLHFH